ncbi:MAG: hypothetical protein K0A93_08680 [Desulfuromonadaceae bacterium]|nr:hypothetical protein [Desulfuromonadaceae bacterium]
MSCIDMRSPLVARLLVWLVVVLLAAGQAVAAQTELDPSVLDPSILNQYEKVPRSTSAPQATAADVERGIFEQTQKSWMVGLVDACGWSFGLPDQPRTEDYLAILSGTRLLRVEAEEAKQQLDSVSVKNFRNYGRFSGSGWVSGIAAPTKVHLNFLLPLAGKYQLTANLRLAGFRFHIGAKVLTADGSQMFSRVPLGAVALMSGPLEVVVDIPPNASLDYLELEGEHARRIAPPQGWQADAPLTVGVIARTAVQVVGLEQLLPLSDETILVEAEVIGNTDRAKIVDARHLGAPSGGKWLRMGAGTARLELPLTIEREGLYQVTMRAAANRPVKVTVNGRVEQMVEFPAYLDSRVVGTFRFNAGTNRLSVDLPPRAGIDLVTLQRRSDSDRDYRQLAGLADDDLPLIDAANGTLKILAALGVSR